MFDFLTRGFWEFLIITNIIIGGVWAFIRLYQDLTRPMPLDIVPEYHVEVGASMPRSSSDDEEKRP